MTCGAYESRVVICRLPHVMCLQGSRPRERYGLGPCHPGYFPRLFPAVISRVLLYFVIDGIVVVLFFLHQEFVLVVFSADRFFHRISKKHYLCLLKSKISPRCRRFPLLPHPSLPPPLPPMLVSPHSTAASTAASASVSCKPRLLSYPHSKKPHWMYMALATTLPLHLASTLRLHSTDSWGHLMLQLQSLRWQYACFRSDMIVNFSCMLRNHPDISRITTSVLLQRHGITGSSIISVTLNLGQLYSELSLTEKVGCSMMMMMMMMLLLMVDVLLLLLLMFEVISPHPHTQQLQFNLQQASQCFEWCLRSSNTLATTDRSTVLLTSRASCNLGDIKRMRGDVEGARRCYAGAVSSIEGERVLLHSPPRLRLHSVVV